MAAIMTKSPAGEDIVILSRTEYEDLLDVRDDLTEAVQAREIGARIDSGAEEMLSAAELDDFLAASTPLAFWRRKRGFTQAALAAHTGISQGYLSELESGRKTGDVAILKTIATALKLKIDDLVEG